MSKYRIKILCQVRAQTHNNSVHKKKRTPNNRTLTSVVKNGQLTNLIYLYNKSNEFIFFSK